MNADTLFMAAGAFVGYTYAGYPLLMWMLSRGRRVAAQVEPAEWPEVTVVMAAHNEAQRVAAKIRNLRELDYPQERLRIVVVSDGSTDDTVDVLRRVQDVLVIDCAERAGKANAINLGLSRASTPVVMLCDVRQHIDPPALKRLVSRLLEPGVGAVSGELVHVDPATRVAASIGLYWKYEKWIRRCESLVRSTVGATGALYVIRRELFSPLVPGTLLDDLEIPMNVARQGQRVLFEPSALVFDELQTELAGERGRKIRTLAGNYQSAVRNPWLLMPWRNPLWFQFVSHKIFRLLVPYALVAALFSSLASATPWIHALGWVQAIFYAASVAAILHPPLRRTRLLGFGAVFVDMNMSAVRALGVYLRGATSTVWKKA